MSWLEKWDDWNGRRPLLATILCVLLAFAAVRVILRTFHILAPSAQVDHPQLHSLLAIAQSLLQLLGVIYLWQMRSFAAILFATDAIVIAMQGCTWLLSIPAAFPAGIALYAWYITTRPQNVSQIVA